jgi:hypothetical protein
MAIFPVIQSPCPYKGKLGDILDSEDMCRLCKRQVHDLTAMSDQEKRAFFRSCSDDVCVSYSLPAALASASMLAALGVAAPAASAQETQASVQSELPQARYVTVIVGGAPRIPTYISVGPARTKISVKSYELADIIPGRKEPVCEEHEHGDKHPPHEDTKDGR